MRKRHTRFRYFFCRQARARMAFADTSISLQSFTPQKFRSYHSVPDIWLRAMTVYTGSITVENTYIMEHGCIVDEVAVYIKIRLFRYRKGLAGHHIGMGQKQIEEGNALLVVFSNYFIIHNSQFLIYIPVSTRTHEPRSLPEEALLFFDDLYPTVGVGFFTELDAAELVVKHR